MMPVNESDKQKAEEVWANLPVIYDEQLHTAESVLIIAQALASEREGERKRLASKLQSKKLPGAFSGLKAYRNTLIDEFVREIEED